MKATDAQRAFMEGLGIKFTENITKEEASILISHELRRNKKLKLQKKKKLREKSEAMTDFFLDSDSVMDSSSTRSQVRKIVEDL